MSRLIWELFGLLWWAVGDNLGRRVYREWKKDSEIFKSWSEE